MKPPREGIRFTLLKQEFEDLLSAVEVALTVYSTTKQHYRFNDAWWLLKRLSPRRQQKVSKKLGIEI